MRITRMPVKWKYFHANRKSEKVVNYRNGLPHGPVEVYSADGVRLQEGSYLNGLEDGSWRFYDEKGRIAYEGEYSSGERTGVWYKYDRKGRKKVLKY